MSTLHHPGSTPAERRDILEREDRPGGAPPAARIAADIPQALRRRLRHRALVAVARNHPAEYLAALAAETNDIRSRWN